MKKKIGVLLAVVALWMVVPQTASAAVHWGVRSGLYTEDSNPFLGVEAIVPITGSFYFNPNVEHSFGDNEVTTVNADAHYDIPINAKTFWWVGAGVAGIFPEEGDNDIGGNAIAGIGTRWHGLIPYVQAKAIVTSDSQFVVAGGIRF